MGELMGERVAALARGEWVQAFAVGFEKNNIKITEDMLFDVSANAAWAGWAPRLILHHTGDDFDLAKKDEVPAVALLKVERRVEGENGQSSLWVKVDTWLVDNPEEALKGFVEFSPEVWKDGDDGTWFFPFMAALGGELPLQRGLAASKDAATVFRMNKSAPAIAGAPSNNNDAEEVNTKMTLFERIVAKVGDAAAKLMGFEPVLAGPQADKAKMNLADAVAAQTAESKIWSVLMAFDEAVADIMGSDASDKTSQVKALVGELGTLLEKALAAKAEPKPAEGEVPADDAVKGAAAAAPPPPPQNQQAAPPPAEDPAQKMLTDLVSKVDALLQRVAAVEARLDDKVAAEPETTPVAKGRWEPDELKANMAAQLKARGAEYGKDPATMEEDELVKTVEQFAKDNGLKFGEAYAKLVGQVV